MLKKSIIPAARWTAALIVLLVLTLGPGARGQESLDDLRTRLDELQNELDETTARLEDLRTERDVVAERIGEIELEVDRLDDRKDGLVEKAEERADFLYRQGTAGMLEALVTAEDFGDLLVRADLAARVSDQNNEVFYRLARDEEELTALNEELEERQETLTETTQDLESVSAELLDRFEAVGDEYRELKEKLAEERREAAAEAQTSPSGSPSGPTGPPPIGGNGMFCPVNGPVSFIDSWGAPRVGHTHVGVDMMADYGTPLVAITSGTVSSGSSSTGGISIYLSGDDGNSYWYLHNQENIVTGGHVSAGQLIARVGDTGNATGIPHVHFEYHPGGGGPVNPYPLVASLC